jgi:hypothetical protein
LYLTNFQSGEKMTAEEISAIFSIADANKESKLDYAEVSLYMCDISCISIQSYITIFVLLNLPKKLLNHPRVVLRPSQIISFTLKISQVLSTYFFIMVKIII